MYIKRHAEKTCRSFRGCLEPSLSRDLGRQAKPLCLKKITSGVGYVTLDDPIVRIGLVTLLGFSLREEYGIECDAPFLPTDEYFAERKGQLADISYDEVWQRIHRGSMPELYDNPDFNWQMFYGAYVRTYIERDVRDLSEIGDTVKFTKFMVAAAASTGQLLNLTSLARDVGISQPTAERWRVRSSRVLLYRRLSRVITTKVY